MGCPDGSRSDGGRPRSPVTGDRGLAEVDRLLGDARDRIALLARRTARHPEAALTLRQLIARRRMRSEFLGPGLFADPAWDILLELTAAYLDDQAVPVSAVSNYAAVPATTTLRWINVLVDRGLVTRAPDPNDRRRIYIQLSDSGWEKMCRYLESAGIVTES